MAFPDGPESEPIPQAPRHALFVLGDDVHGVVPDDAPRLVTDLREVAWSLRDGDGAAVRVSTRPEGRFVGLDDAIDNAPDVREALLALSPDPALDRWRRFRPIALAAPVAWSFFVAGDLKQTADLARDARRVTESPEFKAAELDPETAVATRARHEKIDRAIGMRWTYGAVEAAIGLVAAIVVIAGLRRMRAIAIAVGFGAGLWWLFHAGHPERCFGAKAFPQWMLALLGVGGAIATLLLAPSETRVIARLRERMGLPTREVRIGPKDSDLFATIAAAWAGLLLPYLLRGLGSVGLHDLARAAFFVGFCLAAFLVFLAWRREESRVAPRFAWLAVAAALGFGITTACDVAARASFGTIVELQTCVAPQAANKLKKVQESSARETTAARKETQTQALAFWVAVLAAPLAEEMLYRGTLQRVARRRFGSRWSMVISALVFGVAHALAFPAAFYQHFGLGLAFAAVFELAGAGAVGVVASAATHALWNGWLAAMPVF